VNLAEVRLVPRLGVVEGGGRLPAVDDLQVVDARYRTTTVREIDEVHV
jgi:hypothetical protein